MPLAIIFVVLMGVIVLSVVLMVYFTRRHQKKTFELEGDRQLELMTCTNAYMYSTFENAITELKNYDLEYNYASLEIVSELGEGAFGRVFKARAPGLVNEFVAVKVLKEEADSENVAAFIAEVKTSAQFEHPNVIRTVGICTQTPQKCMIFEYMDLGSLNDVLRQSDPENPDKSPSSDVILSPEQFLACCLQVAQGLRYLADLKFVHRDIAARNCLIDHNHIVKIADFGMSREVCAADYYRVSSAKACLPVRWMPPEALLYGKFTVKSDVWSYGVLMWEVYTYAHQPFSGISNYEVIDRIKEGQILECPDLCPASVYDIMKSCWTKVPRRRPTMATILVRMGHLLRSNSMNLMDDYTLMNSSEGYYNLAFGVVAKEEDLKEKKRVDRILQGQDSMEEVERETMKERREEDVDTAMEEHKEMQHERDNVEGDMESGVDESVGEQKSSSGPVIAEEATNNTEIREETGAT